MQVSELFEGSAKFSVEHKLGRHRRAHEMSMSKVVDSLLFSPAEKRRISKLDIGDKITTRRSTIQGTTLITVTRTS